MSVYVPPARSISAQDAARLASVAKALADPIRVQILDVLRTHAGDVCQCELQPLFDVTQPTLSHHLRKLRDAGLIEVERRGSWAYYALRAGAAEDLRDWLSLAAERSR
jgi:ArsR family transcriptional regulator